MAGLPTFELRIVHDHLYKMNGLFDKRRGVVHEVPKFLKFTSLLPPVIYGERSEEKLLFVRVYVILSKAEDLEPLIDAAEQVNATMGFDGASRSFGSAGWLEPWNDGSLRKWGDMFEERVGKA